VIWVTIAMSCKAMGEKLELSSINVKKRWGFVN
jgi:hypothetical protein